MENMETDKLSTIGQSLLHKRIYKAWSSLAAMCFVFDDGQGLLLQAGDIIKLSICAAADLPQEKEAVCKVDWSWIETSVIMDIAVSSRSVSLVLNPAGPLKIDVQTWQGKPFLAFMPYRPAR